jgi:hypothetical protein
MTVDAKRFVLARDQCRRGGMAPIAASGFVILIASIVAVDNGRRVPLRKKQTRLEQLSRTAT